MIKQLQMGFKLLKYTHGVITNIVSLVITLGVGILFELTAFRTLDVGVNVLNNAGSYFILISALYVLQMLISLNVPNVVAVSPWKKRIQTSVFAISGGVTFGVTFLIVLVLKLLKYSFGMINAADLVTELMSLPGMIIIVLLYMAFCLKYFVASTIVFCFTLPIAMYVPELGLFFGWFSYEKISVGMAVAICVLAVLLAAVLAYGVACLIYKKPISKYSQMNGLKKKM